MLMLNIIITPLWFLKILLNWNNNSVMLIVLGEGVYRRILFEEEEEK